MTDVERVSYDALNRTNVFGGKNVLDWTPVAPALPTTAQTKTIQLYGDLSALMLQLKPVGSDQKGGTSEFHAGTTHKAVLRAGLLTELRRYHDTAATLAEVKKQPQIMDKFRMPHGTNDKEVADQAGEIANAAEALATDFEGLGYEAGFADALRQDITDFRSAKDEQAGGLEKQVGKNAEAGALIAQGLLILKQLRVLMGNLYKSNAEKSGEWQTAQHVEKLSHKKKPKPPTPTPQ